MPWGSVCILPGLGLPSVLPVGMAIHFQGDFFMLVLVVDDSRTSRKIIISILRELRPDWNVAEAGNADEAMAVLAAEKPDFCTLDINMPGMDGLELAALLRRDYPQMRICMLTANVQESSRQTAAALGVGFARKPISKDCVGEAIAHFEAAP